MRSQWDVFDVELITLETKCTDFMRFSSISINLLKIFRIISFVFDLKYLSQNSINFNMLGVFWNPQDEQFPKLSLDLYLEQHLKEILRFFTATGAVCHHCMPSLSRIICWQLWCNAFKLLCLAQGLQFTRWMMIAVLVSAHLKSYSISPKHVQMVYLQVISPCSK